MGGMGRVTTQYSNGELALQLFPFLSTYSILMCCYSYNRGKTSLLSYQRHMFWYHQLGWLAAWKSRYNKGTGTAAWKQASTIPC